MRTVEVPGLGLTSCCLDCLGEPPIVYPVGRPVPLVGDGLAQRHVRVCGVCRLAARPDDPMTDAVRLKGEDLRNHPTVEEGCYQVCRACLEYFTPIVQARLVRDGILRPGQPMSRNYLL